MTNDRNDAIVGLRSAGIKVRDLARVFDVTTSRIHQVLDCKIDERAERMRQRKRLRQERLLQMNYSVAAHQTKYSGVVFRSRLEARWAAYFDLVSWGWDYEPIDLQGWVPDFRLTLPWAEGRKGEYRGLKYVRDEHPFVEIKPTFTFDGFPIEKIARALGVPAEQEVLLLGSTPDAVWRIPDGGWCSSMLLESCDADKWKEAGNITQWKKDK